MPQSDELPCGYPAPGLYREHRGHLVRVTGLAFDSGRCRWHVIFQDEAEPAERGGLPTYARCRVLPLEDWNAAVTVSVPRFVRE